MASRPRYALDLVPIRSYPQAAVFWRDHWSCVYCGRVWWDITPPPSGVVMVLDHVFPSSLGGEWIVGNLVSCCLSCNSRKRDRRLRNEVAVLEDIARRSLEELMDPQGRVSRSRGSLERHLGVTFKGACDEAISAYDEAIDRGVDPSVAHDGMRALLRSNRPGPFIEEGLMP